MDVISGYQGREPVLEGLDILLMGHCDLMLFNLLWMIVPGCIMSAGALPKYGKSGRDHRVEETRLHRTMKHKSWSREDDPMALYVNWSQCR